MFERTGALFIVFVLAGCAASPSPAVLDRFVGCWVNDSGTSHEIWVRHDARQLIGFSVSMKQGQLRAWEHMSLDSSGGSTTFTAHPSGQTRTEFALVDLTDKSVRFENPIHDFPQWIEYRWQESMLLAEIGTLDSDQGTVLLKRRCDDE